MYSTEAIDPNVDPYGFMGFIKNPDGSLTRIPNFIPTTPPCPDPSSDISVLTKDVYINQQTGTFVRIYLPRPVPVPVTARSRKLPLILYFHGGGFVIASAASTMFHKFCCDLVRQIPAVMVSVDYRLVPEHRLPAAYTDCMEALHWARTTNDTWLTRHADVSKCFLMGTSAGGNIAYHMGLHVAGFVDRLLPMRIHGLILHQPYFGGVERTPSEIRLEHNMVIPLIITDIIWDLVLPVGANRDHEYSNAMKYVQDGILDKMKNEGWRFLVTGYDGDPLVDRQIEIVKMLRERGVDVREKFGEGGFHGVEFTDEAKATILYGVVKNFILHF